MQNIFENFIVKLQPHHKLKQHINQNLFNYGGKVKKIGTCNELNQLAYNELKPYLINMRNALDIGARWGEWTKIIQNDFNHVYCFEPIAKRYKFIPENCKLDNITLYGCCLGDKNTKVNMYGGSIFDVNKPDVINLMTNKDKLSIQVSLKLDDLNIDNVDFMKIDVEGFELPVLKGAIKTIMKYKPIICLEQNGSEEKWRGAEKNEAMDFLLSIGMKMEKQLNYQDYLFVWKQ